MTNYKYTILSMPIALLIGTSCSLVQAYNVEEYSNTLPAMKINIGELDYRYDQRVGVKAPANINQSVSGEGVTKAEYKPSERLSWQPKSHNQPIGAKAKTLGILQRDKLRIPVRGEGNHPVVDRVVLFDSKGQMYYTHKYGQQVIADTHYPISKVKFNLDNLSGSVDGNGILQYRPSNQFKAAQEGYIVSAQIPGSSAKDRIVQPPSFRVSSTPNYAFSGRDGRNGSSGRDGSKGNSSGSSGWGGAAVSALGSIGGGSGGSGSNAGRGSNGGNGGRGSDGQTPSAIRVTAKALKSPFYKLPLFHYEHRQGSNRKVEVFEYNQSVRLVAKGGSGGQGGRGGHGGDGGDGGHGAAGRKGSNASKYSNAGSGGRGGNGGNGGKGGNGSRGGNGGNGGSGGTINVTTLGDGNFKNQMRRNITASLSGGSGGRGGNAGKAGDGGAAGAGGPGGPGGNSYFETKQCTTDYQTGYQSCTGENVNRYAGSSGSSGSRGRSGSDGRSGSSGSSGRNGRNGRIVF